MVVRVLSFEFDFNFVSGSIKIVFSPRIYEIAMP